MFPPLFELVQLRSYEWALSLLLEHSSQAVGVTEVWDVHLDYWFLDYLFWIFPLITAQWCVKTDGNAQNVMHRTKSHETNVSWCKLPREWERRKSIGRIFLTKSKRQTQGRGLQENLALYPRSASSSCLHKDLPWQSVWIIFFVKSQFKKWSSKESGITMNYFSIVSVWFNFCLWQSCQLQSKAGNSQDCYFLLNFMLKLMC